MEEKLTYTVTKTHTQCFRAYVRAISLTWLSQPTTQQTHSLAPLASEFALLTRLFCLLPTPSRPN